ncbi:MAG: glycosyltransferase family 39 protein [Thermomicrobiales bacterium]|nr:glycosyltransferase family 39 protein [Thermomicrobiales bacterium]
MSLGVVLLTLAVVGALAVERWRTSLGLDSSEPEAAVAQAPVGRWPIPAVVSARDRSRPAVRAHRPVQVALFLAGFILLLLGQQGLNTGFPANSSFVIWFAGLALLVVVEWQCSAIPLPERPLTRSDWTHPVVERWRWLLLAPVVLASIFIIDTVPGRSSTNSSLDVVLLWLLSVVGLVVASGVLPDRMPAVDLRASARRYGPEALLALAILLFAAVPRFYDLSNYAWSMSGDEGTFGTTARATLEGRLRNPFFSGPWGYPSLLFIIQGWFIDLFGGTVGSARMLSALFGVGSVLAVWLLVREHFGRYPALLAALVCGSMHMHVYWSRDAQNASAPMFFLPLALYFLDKGLIGGSRANALAAGFTIAASQFFHPANRLLIPMALCYLAYALILRTWQGREISLRVWGKTLTNGFWIAAAIIVGHLPLMAYFIANPVEFWSRTDEVSVFASGWLEREQGITGDSAFTIMVRQVWHAFLMPFSFPAHGHYRPESPLVGWPLVVFVAFGCALATVWFLRRSYFPFALGFWVATVGLGFTDGPPMTNRYTAATPFLAALAAIGLWGLASIAVKLLKAPRILAVMMATAVALFAVFWNFHFYFHDPNQVNLYSDGNSQMANQIAREAAPLGPGTTVYLSGAPVLWYYGFQNIPFIAPNAVGVDVDPMWDSSQTPPELTGPTLFVFIPARIGELDVVRGWFPDGTTTVHTLPNGAELFTSYLVVPSD